MDSVSPGKTSPSAKKRKMETCDSAAVSNQDNHILNMDLLSMSMVLDMAGLDGTLALGKTSKLANVQVRSYFRDCGPSRIVQRDINFWLEHRDQNLFDQPQYDQSFRIYEPIDNDFFLSTKTVLSSRSLEKKWIVVSLLRAAHKDKLKLVKWIFLANFEIEKDSMLKGVGNRTYDMGFRGVCKNEGPNSLTIIDLFCGKFSITKAELLEFGSPWTTFPVMKYFFEHFDLTGKDCRKWQSECLIHCCANHELENVKYFVERLGLTAADARLVLEKKNYHFSIFDIVLSRDVPFVQYFVDTFQLTEVDFRKSAGLSRVVCVETAKWLIKRFNLDGDDVRSDEFIAVCEAARNGDVELFKYFIVEFGITEEEVRNQDCMIDILNSAYHEFSETGESSCLEWLQSEWNIRPDEFNDIVDIYEEFDCWLLNVDLTHLSECEHASNLLYLFEKIHFNVPSDNEYSMYWAAHCRKLIREGWLRFAKSIIGSWMIAPHSKLTQMVTFAARRGKFAIVKLFMDHDLYQLPRFIYLHHGDVKLKIPRELCAKFVREADTNVELDVGLTDNQINEILCFKPSFICLLHNYEELKLPRELCEHLVDNADERVLVRAAAAEKKKLVQTMFTSPAKRVNVQVDFDLADPQIEMLRAGLNFSIADDGRDGFESDDPDAEYREIW